MTRDEFLVYMNHFNNKEYSELTEYFSDDIIVEYYDKSYIGKHTHRILRGKEEFVASYTELHKRIREYLDLGFCLYDGEHLIVELYTEFHALEAASMNESGEMEKGDVFCITNWVCYDFTPEGKFSHIRIAHFCVHDPSTKRFDPQLRP